MKNSPQEYERIDCNNCGPNRQHEIIQTREHRDEEDDSGYNLWSHTVNEMLECCGCQEITLRRRFFFSEWGPGDVEITYYPPRVARRLPPWKDKLPQDMVALLEEVYKALHADSRRLAMMGARALIDMVILRTVGDVGTFAEKLNALTHEGYLAEKGRQVLEVGLDVGSAAAHRGHHPQPEHVNHVMDIVEHLLQSTILLSVVKELKKATPRRRRKK